MAALYLRDLADKTPPMGPTADRTINEHEARIVRRIFEDMRAATRPAPSPPVSTGKRCMANPCRDQVAALCEADG